MHKTTNKYRDYYNNGPSKCLCVLSLIDLIDILVRKLCTDRTGSTAPLCINTSSKLIGESLIMRFASACLGLSSSKSKLGKGKAGALESGRYLIKVIFLAANWSFSLVGS